jgi:hypothetical protein
MPHVHVKNNLGGSIVKTESRSYRRKLRIATLARRSALNPAMSPVICQLNGKPILQRDWKRTLARRNDIVIFTVLPRGAGTRSIASLAVLIVAAIAAPYLAPGIAGAFGIASGTAAFAGVSAATTAALAPGGDYQLDAMKSKPHSIRRAVSLGADFRREDRPSFGNLRNSSAGEE